MSEKLPVFATLKEGWTVFLRDGRRVALWLVILGLVGVVGQIILASATGWPTIPTVGQMPPQPPNLQDALLGAVVMLAIYAVLLPICTSYQRLVLQGPQARVGLSYRREEWLVLWGLIRIALFWYGACLAFAVPLGLLGVAAVKLAGPAAGIFVGLIAVPALLASMIYLYRLALLLPAAADGHKVSLRQALAAGKNNTWPLVALALVQALFFLPLELVLFLLGLASPYIVAALYLPLFFALMLYQSGVWALAYRQLLRPSLLAAAAPSEE